MYFKIETGGFKIIIKKEYQKKHSFLSNQFSKLSNFIALILFSTTSKFGS